MIKLQLNNIYTRYKVICGCECCISATSINLLLLSWHDIYLRKLKDLSKNSHNRRSNENSNIIFETYKNYVMPYERQIYATAAYTAMDTMCAYPPYQY